MLKRIANWIRPKKIETAEPMCRKVLDDGSPDAVEVEFASTATLDACLTKLVWEKALRSHDDGVAVAIRQLMTALEQAEKNSDAAR